MRLVRPGLVTVTVDGAEVGGAHSVALSERVLTCACPASLSWATEALAVATGIFAKKFTLGHTLPVTLVRCQWPPGPGVGCYRSGQVRSGQVRSGQVYYEAEVR